MNNNLMLIGKKEQVGWLKSLASLEGLGLNPAQITRKIPRNMGYIYPYDFILDIQGFGQRLYICSLSLMTIFQICQQRTKFSNLYLWEKIMITTLHSSIHFIHFTIVLPTVNIEKIQFNCTRGRCKCCNISYLVSIE